MLRLLNLFLRLGWSRWCLFQLLKRLRLRRLARKVAPVDWNLIHDEVRIYGGYFRFVPILALVVARAFVYGLLPATSPRFALFNASAGWALLVMLIAELMEDLVVVQELLPYAPVAAEWHERDQARECLNEPGQLVAVEVRPTLFGRPARRDCASNMTFDSVSEIPLQPSPGLPASPASVDAERLAERSTRGRWGRLRAALGQRQQLVPALSLHGIRELPFRVQLGACYVIMEVTMGLLSALLGPGYLRGLFDKPCEPSAVQAMLTYLLWDVPLSC